MTKRQKPFTHSALWIRLALILLVFLIFFGYNWRTFQTSNSIYYKNPDVDSERLAISGQLVEQYITAVEAIRGLEIALYQDKLQGPLKLSASLYEADSDKLLGHETVTIEPEQLSFVASFNFPSTEAFALGRYYLRIESLNPGQTLYAMVDPGDYKESLLINETKIASRLVLRVNYQNQLMLSFLIFTAVLLLISLLLLFFPTSWKLRTEDLFLVIALICGVAITFVAPSGQEPDGSEHLLRVFDVSYGNYTPVLTPRSGRQVIIPSDITDFNDTVLRPDLNQGFLRIREMQEQYFEDGNNHQILHTYKRSYPVLMYWPQGTGFKLARDNGLNIFHTMALARSLNLLAYLLFSYLAIKMIPVFKNLLLSIALLPIAVFQASSLSSDSMINSMSFLFIALMVKLWVDRQPIRLSQLILPLLLLYYVVMAKPTYLFLAGLLLLIPLRDMPKVLAMTLRVMLVLVPALIIGAILFGFSSGRLMMAEGLPYYETQLDFAMHNVHSVIDIYLHTLNVNGLQYLIWLNTLGWLNYSLGLLVIGGPIFLVLVGLLDQPDQLPIDRLHKILIWAIVILTVSAIFVGIYLFEAVNDVGGTIILGVQGRYFIPILLLPFLALGNRFKTIRSAHFAQHVAGINGLILVYTLYTLTRLIY